MNRRHQLLFYADDVNVLGENLQTVRENAELFIKASKDIEMNIVLRVFENKVLRKIFGAKTEEITGEWRKLHNDVLHV